jgi:hypothetical protein
MMCLLRFMVYPPNYPLIVICEQIFAFDRTISRLLEMRSESYRAALAVKRPDKERTGGPNTLRELLLRNSSSNADRVLSTNTSGSASVGGSTSAVDAASKGLLVDMLTGKGPYVAVTTSNTSSTRGTSSGGDSNSSSSSSSGGAATSGEKKVVGSQGQAQLYRDVLRRVWKQYNWGREPEEPAASGSKTAAAPASTATATIAAAKASSISTSSSTKSAPTLVSSASASTTTPSKPTTTPSSASANVLKMPATMPVACLRVLQSDLKKLGIQLPLGKWDAVDATTGTI